MTGRTETADKEGKALTLPALRIGSIISPTGTHLEIRTNAGHRITYAKITDSEGNERHLTPFMKPGEQ